MAPALERLASARCVNTSLFSLSWELWDAPCASSADDRVALYLREHAATIAREAEARRVSRISIAGVIAYEALENQHYSNYFGLTRSNGPGKVHYKEFFFAEGNPIAKEVEASGFLPMQSMEGRARLLASADGAIRYIAAIMDALDRATEGTWIEARCQPAVEATLYNTFYLRHVRFALKGYVKRRPFEVSGIGRWVLSHQSKLRSAVGESMYCRSHPRKR